MDKSGKFVQEYRGGFRVLRRPSEAAESLRDLLPDPDRAFLGAEIFKPGSRTHAGVVTLAGGRYFLKRYNCRGWLYRLQNAFRRSRAVRTWHATWAFVERQVPVPRPILCLEERSLRLLGRSYILMQYASGREPLVHVLPQLDGVRRRALLEQLGVVLGRMHRSGCLHGDLKWSNILVADGGAEGWNICLVDLDGSRVLPAADVGRARRDLRRFLKDLERQVPAGEREDFLRIWRDCLRAESTAR